MRITVGPWFWAAYLALTALLFLVCSGVLYVSAAMAAVCR
jgi:hypothetical protein